MANDQRKAKSWMQSGGGAAKNPAPSQKRGWHPTAPATKATDGRKRSLLLPAIAGAVLLGVIVAVILMIRGYRPARIVAIGPSEANTLALPQNVGGANSIKSVADWTKEGRSRPKLAQEPNETIKIEDWADGLDGREDVVTLYFCLQGGSDAKGAYLWLVPPEATAPAEKYKLRLSTILDRLAQLPEEKKKVLILDATQVTVNFPLGQLHNDFVRELKKKEFDDRIEKIPNLVVISASDEDQKSWYSEEWQQTIFTHYFVEGAKGAAHADRVSVERLYEFVKDRVPAWTRSNRGEDQVPILLPAKSGLERAKKIELATVSHSNYKAVAAASAPGANFDIPEELSRAWERRDRLEKSTPRPEAIAPFQTRRYLDTLLRIESMLRAGMPRAEVQNRLDRLAKDEPNLTRNPWPELRSVANALPMPAALGTPGKPMLESGQFLALWADPVNVWPELKGKIESQGDTAIRQLQFDVCSQLLDFLMSDNRPENIAKADAVLKKVFGPASAPIEAHVLLIFHRDLDPKAMPDWPTLKLALQVHRLAETVALIGGAGPDEYSASELVFPWIRDAVAKADVSRLRGEDLLISNVPSDWSKANALLSQAKEQYEVIGKQARQIRQALTARNQAMAELPYLARWVAGLSDEFEGDSERPRKLLELVERTAEGMHRLALILEAADPNRLADLNATANGVSAGLDELRKTFFEFLPKLSAEVLVSKWHHIDNALQVPFIPFKRRMELLANLRTISNALNSKFENVATPPPPANSGSLALERAQRQGRIALALLGSAWVNDPVMRDQSGGAIKLKFEDLKQRIDSPKGSWWESVDEVGEQIGWHWRALASRVDELTEKANRDALTPAVQSLARADYLARLADSATGLGKDRDPVVDYRRHRLHRFLLDQARRSIAANWAAAELAAERASKPSFAKETATRFVDDAEQLIMIGADKNPTSEDRARVLAEVKPIRDALDIQGYNVSPDEPSIELTDRRDFRVGFRITPPAGQPVGYPVLRFRTDGPCKLPADATTARKPIADFVDFGKSSTQEVRNAEVDLASVSKAPGLIEVEVWYRGHRYRGKSTVLVNGEPSSIWVYKPPQGDAGFMVRAGAEFRKGAVAIALDWSYSMVNTGTDKYNQAVEALEAVLQSLPPGTTVSIMQFGDPSKSSSDRPDYLEPKEYDFKRRPEELDQLIERLRRNRPKGINSPIARAITKLAQNDVGFPRNFPGFKTILVLTDGEDNVDRAESGNVVFRELAPRHIAVKMCFFQPVGNEEKNARDQFEKIRDLDTKGEFFSATEKGDLISKLLDAMTPRVQVHYPEGDEVRDIEGSDRRGVRVSIQGERVDSFARLPKGAYDLVEKNSRTGRMQLEPGDRLLLELERVGRTAVFQPARYIPTIRADQSLKLIGNSSGDKPITAMVSDAHLTPHEGGNREYDLDMLVLMEPGHSRDLLKVTRPQFAWIETRTQNENQGPNALFARVENQSYLPCPAWRIRVWKWPALPEQQNALLAPSRPLVSLWWSDALPSDPYVIARDSGKSLADSFDNKSFSRDEKNIKILSARYENDYLVVELAYPPGPPLVLVRPEGLKDSPRLTMEEEHRFYDKAGRYTARFGPVEEGRQGQAFRLLFYSMNDLKKASKKIDLRPNFSPTIDPPLGQSTPAPFERK